MPASPVLVVFLGGFGDSPAEHLVDDARTAATLDSIDAWLAADIGSAVLVASTRVAPRMDVASVRRGGSASPLARSSLDLAGRSGTLILDVDDGPFHFGRRLSEVIRRHNLSSLLYMGGGSMPLFGTDDLSEIAGKLTEGTAVTNNLFSSDLIAFPVTDAVLAVAATIDRDNSLARALHEHAEFPVEGLPRTLANQFDIDTPADVAVLALLSSGDHPPGRIRLTGGGAIGPRLREYLASIDIDLSRYHTVLPLFLDQAKQITVAGRVGTHAWTYLERETACRVRLFAEERGMEADGRAERGEARSLLGYHIDEVGVERFFETLAELGDAAFIDTRVLLAHKRIDATREDRFLSDLGAPDDITDPFLRDFTRAALSAPIPILLGGHSLMSGGLMALNEYAWSLRDEGGL